MKKFTLIAGIIILFFSGLSAQDGIVKFLDLGKNDANKVIGAYLKPFANGLGIGLNNGWFNTAKTHGTLGFDISLTANLTFIPEADKTYEINSLGLEYSHANSGSNISSTVAGGGQIGTFVSNETDAFGEPVYSYKAPDGANLSMLPLPVVKMGFGLPKGFEIVGKFIPTVKSGGTSLNLWGIGVKHDIKQWIPGEGLMPFSMSLLVAYSRLNAETALDYEPRTDEQKLALAVKSFTAGLLVSKKITVLTVYGSVSYNTSSTLVDVLGTYTVIDETTPGEDSITDPISVNLNDVNTMQFTAGMRLKFAIITFHADYSYAKYHSVTAGIGISFR